MGGPLGEQMGGILADAKHAVRSLRRSPGYVTLALITLALGIGANTAVFSVIRSVLLRPLPYPQSGELVRAWEVNSSGAQMQVAWRNFEDLEAAGSFRAMALHGGAGPTTVLGLDEALRVNAAPVSRDFFATLGVPAAVGRTPRADEHVRGAGPVVVVSHGFWRDHLGADPDLTDRRIGVAGFEASVVGVMPRDFDYPEGVRIWYPIELSEQSEHRTAHNYSMIGRLGPGVTPERASAELDAIVARFADPSTGGAEVAQDDDYFPRRMALTPLLDSLVAGSRRPLWILLAAAGLVLLVGCTNLASTTLARGTRREREVAVRRALGAGRGRVTRLLFVESLVLSLAGGAVGVGLASLALSALPLVAPAGMPRVAEVGLDPLVLGFALAASTLTAVVFGLVPALRGSETRLSATLRAGGRGGSDRGREGVWSGLVAAETALAILLLVGAGLLIRSFGGILAVDAGYRTSGVVLAELSPPPVRYGEPEQRGVYYQRVLEAVRAAPGVEEAGLISRAPLSWVANGLVQVRGGEREAVSGYYQAADAGYFSVMGIALLRGRLFSDRDHAGAPHVVVVNEAFANLAWPGEDPIGKEMTGGGMDNYWNQEKWATVVGVVANVRQADLARPPSPTYYFHYAQRPFRTWTGTLTIRGVGGAARGTAVVPAVREVVRAIDPDVPAEFSTIEQRLSRSMGDRRFTMLVLGAFALVALVLAAVGIYGVVSYSVARRRREMGIRLALGAEPAAVRALAQRRVLVPAAVGLVVGIAAAVGLSRLLESLLHEISPTDPVTFAAVALVMASVAWVAGWIPARRTARIDPMETIRTE